MARIYQYARIAITAEKKLTQGRTTAVFGRHLSCSGEILRRQKQAFERVYKSHQNIKQIQDRTFLNTTNKLLLYNKCWTAKWKFLQVQNFWHGTPEEKVWCLGFQHAYEKNGHVPWTSICTQLQNQSHSLVYALSRTESSLPVRRCYGHVFRNL